MDKDAFLLVISVSMVVESPVFIFDAGLIKFKFLGL